jgi:hypothetical protein
MTLRSGLRYSHLRESGMEKKSLPSEKRGFVRIGRDLFCRNSALTDRIFLKASLREVKSWAGPMSAKKIAVAMKTIEKKNFFILPLSAEHPPLTLSLSPDGERGE